MASLILATMSVNSLEHIFVNIFFFSNIFFSFLEYIFVKKIFFSNLFFLTWSTWCDRGRPWQRRPRSRRGRTPGSPRRPPRTCATCRVSAIFHHFGAVFLGLFEFSGPCFKRCVVQMLNKKSSEGSQHYWRQEVCKVTWQAGRCGGCQPRPWRARRRRRARTRSRSCTPPSRPCSSLARSSNCPTSRRWRLSASGSDIS